MDPLLARYPFLDAAREAVRRDGPSIEELVTAGGHSATLDRAQERVDRALEGDTVGLPRDPEVELLSYPLARIIVSLIDDDRVRQRYVRAEAATAVRRLKDDVSDDRPDESGVDIAWFLDELGIDGRSIDDGVSMPMADYLRLAPFLEGSQWRLVNRRLRDGSVPVTDDELYELIRVGVEDRVGTGLPLDVPPSLEGQLGDVVSTLTDRLDRVTLSESFSSIDPTKFPPCVTALIDRVEADEGLSPHGHFALAAFLTSIGLTGEDFETVIDGEIPPTLRDVAESVAGSEGPTQLPPGTCETMVAFGDCVNPDSLCERIDHPLQYYAARLDGKSP